MKSPVINLSTYILSDAQMSLLSKGLGFSPTNNLNVFGTILDVNRFARTLTLRNHFLNKGIDADTQGIVLSPCLSDMEFIHPTAEQPENLLFGELCNISVLRTRASESSAATNNTAVCTYTPKYSGFYPYQSRPGVLDIFQETVERDLVKLKSESRSPPI